VSSVIYQGNYQAIDFSAKGQSKFQPTANFRNLEVGSEDLIIISVDSNLVKGPLAISCSWTILQFFTIHPRAQSSNGSDSLGGVCNWKSSCWTDAMTTRFR